MYAGITAIGMAMAMASFVTVREKPTRIVFLR